MHVLKLGFYWLIIIIFVVVFIWFIILKSKYYYVNLITELNPNIYYVNLITELEHNLNDEENTISDILKSQLSNIEMFKLSELKRKHFLSRIRFITTLYEYLKYLGTKEIELEHQLTTKLSICETEDLILKIKEDRRLCSDTFYKCHLHKCISLCHYVDFLTENVKILTKQISEIQNDKIFAHDEINLQTTRLKLDAELNELKYQLKHITECKFYNDCVSVLEIEILEGRKNLRFLPTNIL